MLMTKDVLVAACKDNGGYKQPHLNDQLFLQCKGFCEISNLEEYTEVKALWLEQNGLNSVENIGHLSKLASLFVQNNVIRTMSGFQGLSNLRTLNLSHNYIRKVEGLSGCPLLETLQLSHNQIESLEDMTELWDLKELSSLDVSHNQIGKPDNVDPMYIVAFFKHFKMLSVLYLHGQELPRTMKNYRKNMVSQLKQLTYLDDRPIFPQERRTADAWLTGGADAEKAELVKIREEKEYELTACVRNQERFKTPASLELREKREREYQEQMQREKEWRVQLRIEYVRKFAELDGDEDEGRYNIENEAESLLQNFATAAEGDRKNSQDRQAAREAAVELQAQLDAEKAEERKKRQAKFDEMRFWVKKFAQGDSELETQMHADVHSLLAGVSFPSSLVAAAAAVPMVPSDGPSTTGSVQHVPSATDSIIDERSSNASQGRNKNQKKAARWAADAARFEAQYRASKSSN